MTAAKTKRIASATANLQAVRAKYAEAIAMNQTCCYLDRLRVKVWIAQERLERAQAD